MSSSQSLSLSNETDTTETVSKMCSHSVSILFLKKLCQYDKKKIIFCYEKYSFLQVPTSVTTLCMLLSVFRTSKSALFYPTPVHKAPTAAKLQTHNTDQFLHSKLSIVLLSTLLCTHPQPCSLTNDKTTNL